MEERFGLCMESGLCQRMDLRSKHLDSMQWRVSMAAVELNYPVDFSKIMEFEGFGRRAKVTSQSSQSHQHLAMMIIDGFLQFELLLFFPDIYSICKNDSFSFHKFMFQYN